MSDQRNESLITLGLSSVAAAAVSGLSLFALFRLGVELLGVAVVGSWALIQGLLMIARVVDSGLGANITRYSVPYRYAANRVMIRRLVLGSILIGPLPVALVGLLLLFPVAHFTTAQFGHVLAPSDIRFLAGCALATGVLTSFATGALSIMEGFGGLSTKNLILISSQLISLVAAYPLITVFGVAGFGMVYVIGASAQLVGASTMLHMRFGGGHHDGETVREIVRTLWHTNVQLSLMAFLRLSFEPVTKLALGASGSLSLIAAFELGLKITTLVRTLVQSALQPLLAFGVRESPTLDPSKSRVFESAHLYLRRISYLGVALQIAASPLLSTLGLGTLDLDFVVILAILAVGSGTNTSGSVGYLFQLGGGAYGSIVRIYATMAPVNVAAAVAAKLVGDPLVAIVGYSLAFGYGGIASARLLPPSVSSKTWTASELRWWMAQTAALSVCAFAFYISIYSYEFRNADFLLVVFCSGACAAFVSLSGLRILRSWKRVTLEHRKE